MAEVIGWVTLIAVAPILIGLGYACILIPMVRVLRIERNRRRARRLWIARRQHAATARIPDDRLIDP